MADEFAADTIQRVEPPVQFEESILQELLEASALIRVDEARRIFKVEGEGTTVAVLDTGLRTTHVDFAGRVLAQRNFTNDNGGDGNDSSDGNGHGTNVGGIICAGDIHIGMAPKAGIVPLKVLPNQGGGSFAAICDALKWVRDNRDAHGITAVCMSLGDSGNYQDDSKLTGDAVAAEIRALRSLGVATVIAAGNDFFTHGSQQGMGYPAICRECISVGAVYDRDESHGFRYNSGAEAFSTAADRLTPFSQRLHVDVGRACATDIFAPGAPITSSGIASDVGESIQHGTSQATPVIAGIALLLQSFHLKKTKRLPTVDQVEGWIKGSAVKIQDGDDEDDNVTHTGLSFLRVDAMAALTACARELAAEHLFEAGLLAKPSRG